MRVIHLPTYPKLQVNEAGMAPALGCELLFPTVPLTATLGASYGTPRPHGPTQSLQQKGTYVLPSTRIAFTGSQQFTVITRGFKDLLNAARPHEMTVGAYTIV